MEMVAVIHHLTITHVTSQQIQIAPDIIQVMATADILLTQTIHLIIQDTVMADTLIQANPRTQAILHTQVTRATHRTRHTHLTQAIHHMDQTLFVPLTTADQYTIKRSI